MDKRARNDTSVRVRTPSVQGRDGEMGGAIFRIRDSPGCVRPTVTSAEEGTRKWRCHAVAIRTHLSALLDAESLARMCDRNVATRRADWSWFCLDLWNRAVPLTVVFNGNAAERETRGVWCSYSILSINLQKIMRMHYVLSSCMFDMLLIEYVKYFFCLLDI